MKTITFIALWLLMMAGSATTFGQDQGSQEKYGKTFNAGIGFGYYKYVGHPRLALHADIEFDVVRNFTIAPFITYYSYDNYHYWGNPHYPYRNYHYRQTVIPIGIKSTYYFDEILGAGSPWDFYLAGSLGFAIRRTTWESGYYGESYSNQGAGALYLDLHIGAEYHLSRQLGVFLDLSSGISTAGLAVHF